MKPFTFKTRLEDGGEVEMSIPMNTPKEVLRMMGRMIEVIETGSDKPKPYTPTPDTGAKCRCGKLPGDDSTCPVHHPILISGEL